MDKQERTSSSLYVNRCVLYSLLKDLQIENILFLLKAVQFCKCWICLSETTQKHHSSHVGLCVERNVWNYVSLSWIYEWKRPSRHVLLLLLRWTHSTIHLKEPFSTWSPENSTYSTSRQEQALSHHTKVQHSTYQQIEATFREGSWFWLGWVAGWGWGKIFK